MKGFLPDEVSEQDVAVARRCVRPVSFIAVATVLAAIQPSGLQAAHGAIDAGLRDTGQSAPVDGAVSGPSKTTSAQDGVQPNSQSRENVTILSLPLIRGEDALGEIGVEIDSDGTARFERFSLLSLLGPLLSDEGKATLSGALAEDTYISARMLDDAGVTARFDMARLEVVLENLSPDLVPVVDLDARNRRLEDRPPTIQPAGFSAFMNVAASLDYLDSPTIGSQLQDPELVAFGAARMGNFALLYEGGATVLEDGDYGLFRRFVRGVYDIEERNLRISAGDLEARSLPLLGSQLIGGVGIERRRRIFDPFEPVFQLGGRRLRINSPSTIEIVNNGNLVRTIPVEQGVYNLDELPLLFGSNNVEIRIRDSAGRTSVTNFDYFYDPVDLEVGDVEYGAFAGFLSNLAEREPTYDGPLGASAFYRKALTPSLLLGGAIQLAEDTQAMAAEIRWVPQIVPGVIETQLAVSSSDGSGIGLATRTGYRWAQNTPQGSRQISFLIDYESSEFELPGQPDFFAEERLNLNVNYGQSLTPQTFLSAGLNHIIQGSRPTRTNLFADVIHQFTDRLRATAGVEYGRNDGFDSEFGARINITYLFGANSRLNAEAQSRRSLVRAGASRGVENRVGSWGYDVNLEQSDGDSFADAALQYRGNRFDGRVLVQSSGNGIGNITDDRRAQLQLSTAFAYADGAFGVGRAITDGFALVEPADGISGEAIVGNNLNDGEYQGRSGLLGAAVVPDILGYQTRQIIYDIDADGTVFDVGDGTDRLRLATGGGAKVVIGNTRFVSAVGTLMIGDGPAALLSGRVVSDSDNGFQPIQFFTNSAGRFAIIGLAPKQTYRIQLDDGRGFELTVPDTRDGLYRVGQMGIEEIRQ